MQVWEERPAEVKALLNPAFVAVLIREVAAGYKQEAGSSLPFVLPFLAVPIVLHEQTRSALPPKVTTSMTAWLNRHGSAQVIVPPVAQDLVPYVREGIRFGLRHAALSLKDAGLEAQSLGRARQGMSGTDVPTFRSSATFVGRWFARAGDPVSVLTAWGLAA
jgi:hypothetical protein